MKNSIFQNSRKIGGLFGHVLALSLAISGSSAQATEPTCMAGPMGESCYVCEGCQKPAGMPCCTSNQLSDD